VLQHGDFFNFNSDKENVMERANYMKAEGRLFIFMCAISLSMILFPIAANAGISPKISVKPNSTNLGSVKVGGVSTPKMLTIKNTGKSELVISSVTIIGTNASEFGFSPENGCPNPISTNALCEVTVTFTPASPFVKKSAMLRFSSNDPKKPTVDVKLSGQAPPPNISVAPKAVKFATVNIGNTSAYQTITVKNTGISDLVINAIAVTGANADEFSETDNCKIVSQGNSCAIAVTLNPTSTGNKAAIMSISSNTPKKPITNVKLSGRGSGGTGQSYSMADLAGTWEMNDLGSPGPWWGRGALAVGSDGSFYGTGNGSDGSVNEVSGTFSITTDGIITATGSDISSSFRCVMDSGKSIVVCTNSTDGGSTDISIITKKASSYSMADLVGIWETNGLGSPGPWWQRGALTIGSDGSFSGIFDGSDGSSESLSGIFSITADGIITATGSNPNPSHRCVMDSGKRIVVCTNSNDNVSTTEMHIFVKKAVSYSMADLVGKWEGNSLASGPCTPWWERASLTINGNGSLTASTVESTGQTNNITGAAGTVSISSDGVVAFHGGSDIDLAGSMDADKTVMVWTGTFGGGCDGGTEIKIFTKKPN
jgi:hypothetical protein